MKCYVYVTYILLLFSRNVGNNVVDGCRFDFSNENYSCPIISVRQIIDMLEYPYDFNDLAINVRTIFVTGF